MEKFTADLLQSVREMKERVLENENQNYILHKPRKGITAIVVKKRGVKK